MPKAAIIGNTTWGKALAALLGGKGITVKLWTRSEDEAEGLNQEAYCYSSTSYVEEALDEAELVILAVPSPKMRENVARIKDYLTDSMVLVSAAKGLEAGTGRRMTQVITEEVAPSRGQQICVLSGPNLAREIAHGLPAASIIAAHDIVIAERARGLINSPNFFLVTSDDVVGVELCGALKNVIALGAGMIDGLGLGDNAKAAFITLGWDEVVSLGLSLGAKVGTFYGLAGLGDLITTCSSTLSRNHQVGYELAKGHSLADASTLVPQVAEGVNTTLAVHQLAKTLNLSLPITNLIYSVLFEDLPLSRALSQFEKLVENHHQPWVDALR